MFVRNTVYVLVLLLFLLLDRGVIACIAAVNSADPSSSSSSSVLVWRRRGKEKEGWIPEVSFIPMPLHFPSSLPPCME